MEDIFTIKVKTEPDTRNLYPSERRYSASTVSGLAWVHLALAATSFVLACLAIVNPIGGGTVTHLTSDDAEKSIVDRIEFLNNISMPVSHQDTRENVTEQVENHSTADEYSWILVISPSLVTVASLAAGIASIMASNRWYVDRNITWLFLMSVLSTAVSVVSFIMIITWVSTSEGSVALSGFYKDKVPFEDLIVIPKSNVVERNESHIIVARNSTANEFKEHVITKRVLSINILIACFLEFLWSLLSLKISYKGMNTSYKDDDELERRGGNCLEVVTTVKGNMKRPRKAKSFTPQPDLINHYPSNNKIKRFLQSERNGVGLKTEDGKITKPVNESNSEYRERMMNFLNRCASFDGGDSNPEIPTPSIQSDVVLKTIPEVKLVSTESRSDRAQSSRVSTISWGDPRDHTIYNQNNLDLDKILKGKTELAAREVGEKDEAVYVKDDEHLYAEVSEVKPIETVEES